MTADGAPAHPYHVHIAEDSEFEGAFRLRWEWLAETQGTGDLDEQAYLTESGAWARAHRDTYLPHVAVGPGHEIVGVAWLALVPRVPTPLRQDRVFGDLQTCYVMPAFRGLGIGGELVRAVLRTAAQRGAEHVTVHSSPKARSMYLRNGFRDNIRLLYADIDPERG